MGSGWNKAPEEGEAWGLNNLISRRPLKRLFLMHDIDLYRETNQFDIEKVIEDVNKAGIPVMTTKKYSYLPNSVEFPLGEMPSKYFTNSFAYMIAYAIHEGATSIHLY